MSKRTRQPKTATRQEVRDACMLPKRRDALAQAINDWRKVYAHLDNRDGLAYAVAETRRDYIRMTEADRHTIGRATKAGRTAKRVYMFEAYATAAARTIGMSVEDFKFCAIVDAIRKVRKEFDVTPTRYEMRAIASVAY